MKKGNDWSRLLAIQFERLTLDPAPDCTPLPRAAMK